MRIFRLISFRLFVLIVIFLSILSILVTYIQFQYRASHYEEIMKACGLRTSTLIKASTHTAMLANRKEDAYDVIKDISQQQGIERIRIYNKIGTIIYSSDENEINTTVNAKNESCLMCHKITGETILEPNTNDRNRIYTNEDGIRLLGVVTAINNEYSCYNSECHYHTEDDILLGTIDVILSLKETDEILQEEAERLISNNIAITLILALTSGAFLWIFVRNPVKKLTNATREISSGNLDHKIEKTSYDEIGLLASSFNQMTEDLKEAKNEITTWSNELEKRVRKKTEELKNTQERILQIEKMASLGKLSASVAHELNNPLAGILTYSKLIQKKLNKINFNETEKEVIIKYLKMTETESERCGNIIKNLLLFSRDDKGNFRLHDINEIIESSLMLVHHHLQLNNIELHKNFRTGIPQINLDENQLKQALLALFINSVEAIEKDGLLTVNTMLSDKGKYVKIEIIDSGKGIPSEIRGKIFEPFFTTKNEVKGVGLGLSIVYGIIKNHHGEISVESEIDKGSTFIIKLPIQNKNI